MGFLKKKDDDKQALLDAELQAKGLLQMYQAGFLDGWKARLTCGKSDKKLWGEIGEKCKRAFDRRFNKAEKSISPKSLNISLK